MNKSFFLGGGGWGGVGAESRWASGNPLPWGCFWLALPYPRWQQPRIIQCLCSKNMPALQAKSKIIDNTITAASRLIWWNLTIITDIMYSFWNILLWTRHWLSKPSKGNTIIGIDYICTFCLLLDKTCTKTRDSGTTEQPRTPLQKPILTMDRIICIICILYGCMLNF